MTSLGGNPFHYNNNQNISLLKYNDFQGYLLALGMSRTAQVKRDARIGEAEAGRDSGIKVWMHKIFNVLSTVAIGPLRNKISRYSLRTEYGTK